MKTKIEKWKGGLARLVLAAFVLQTGTGGLWAAPGPVAVPVDVDLTTIAQTIADIDIANTFLVKWRGADPTVKVTNMTFQYYQTPGRATPNRTNVLDHSANSKGICGRTTRSSSPAPSRTSSARRS
jgi:hypothetical protein